MAIDRIQQLEKEVKAARAASAQHDTEAEEETGDGDKDKETENPEDTIVTPDGQKVSGQQYVHVICMQDATHIVFFFLYRCKRTINPVCLFEPDTTHNPM